MVKKEVVAVDIGATKTFVAVIDNNFNIRNKIEFSTPKGKKRFISILKKKIDWLDPGSKLSVGIAICGLLSVDGKKLLVAPNLKWKDIPLTEFFKPLREKITVVNDGTAAAWGSYITEADKGIDRLLSVTLGTGVGGGLVIDNRLLLGAGELGHIKIDQAGPICGCGKRGCLESFVGGKHIPDRVEEWYNLKIKSSKDLFELAETGDLQAIRCWKRIGNILGYAISGVVNLNGVQAIAVGGKISRAKLFFLKEFKKVLAQNLMDSRSQKCEVFISKWDKNSSLIGAASIVFTPPGNFNKQL